MNNLQSHKIRLHFRQLLLSNFLFGTKQVKKPKVKESSIAAVSLYKTNEKAKIKLLRKDKDIYSQYSE